MKIEKILIEATIPCSQYGNIRPSIEMSDVSIEEASKTGMSLILPLFAQYSEKGGLIPKEIIKATGTKKSFNEEGIEVLFEPLGHTYHFGDKKLVGATEYIKQFYKPFDVETISDVSAKSWGVGQQEVKDLWQANGELTSAFGTVVHQAIEFYHKYKDIGQTISDKKKLPENYAMPKHPILKSIIEGFIAIDKSKGKIIPEALLTNIELGVCGHADMIEIVDEKKKICRIGDIKVNINSDVVDKSQKVLAPFNELPSTKLSKYQLQMSVYANLLQKSGWVVEKLDCYVYEQTWIHYELDVLDVIK